jgi:hypothetical protein
MTHPLTEHVIRFPELPADHERPAGDRVAEIARDMMKVEEARGEAVRSRAAGLLGSCGVLLTLTVGLGDSALKDASRLGRVAAPLAAGLGIAGVVALFVSAVLAGLVFAPSRKAVRTPMAALRAFSELQLRTDDEQTLDGAARHSLHAARVANLLRGNRLLWSISIFLVALLCLAGEAAMVGIDRIA